MTEEIKVELWKEYHKLDDAINNWEGDVRDPLFIELQKQKADVLNNLNKLSLSENESNLSIKKIESEEEIKRYEQSQENKRSIIKGICMGALGILSLGVTIWQTNRAYDFDKTSTFTSTLGRSSVNESTKVNPHKFFKIF
jgi:hypothetical protein